LRVLGARRMFEAQSQHSLGPPRHFERRAYDEPGLCHHVDIRLGFAALAQGHPVCHWPPDGTTIGRFFGSSTSTPRPLGVGTDENRPGSSRLAYRPRPLSRRAYEARGRGRGRPGAKEQGIEARDSPRAGQIERRQSVSWRALPEFSRIRRKRVGNAGGRARTDPRFHHSLFAIPRANTKAQKSYKSWRRP